MVRRKRKGPGFWPGPLKLPGSDLLSHAVSRAVPWAPRGLTAVFGMGTGGTPSIRPPETRFRFRTEPGAPRIFASSRFKNFMAKPHGRLVPVSFAPRSASTPGLSTWSSPTVLQGACAPGKPDLGVGFTLICLQRLSRPNSATRRMPLARQPVHRRFVQPGPLVLRSGPLKFPAPTRDRDRTVSRRSEPSSRTALTGEQPDPWDLLQPQDAMSRHRGAKPCRRCELLGKISLLSPAYLLSVERRPFHTEPPDH